MITWLSTNEETYMLHIHKKTKIPPLPGVYIFRDRSGKALYVGKAGDLKSRLRFYFQNKSAHTLRMKKLLHEAAELITATTDSEIEALVQEAALIKKLRPKYNILMRDDKNYLFVVITNESFPKITFTHQPQLFPHRYAVIGPFTDAGATRIVLNMLRKTFPYCTCKHPHKKACLNAELEKCPGYCCVDDRQSVRSGERRMAKNLPHAQTEYMRNIKSIIGILQGKKISALRRALTRDLTRASKAMEYERASIIRNQIAGLEKIAHHRAVLRSSAENKEDKWQLLVTLLRATLGITLPIHRVEGYDIANISGTAATGSMVVFLDGIPEKSEYRKFKIKTVSGANDVAMIAEVICRRLRHPEWPFPDIMLIDGGKPQHNGAIAALQCQISSAKFPRPFITALAKRDEELYIAGKKFPVLLKKQPREVMHFFQRIRDEAHRFARAYHHKLRRKSFLRESG